MRVCILCVAVCAHSELCVCVCVCLISVLGCVLARCVHAVFLIAHAGAAPPHPELLAHLRANRQFLSRGRGGEREVVHAAAVEAWVSGRPRRAAAVSVIIECLSDRTREYLCIFILERRGSWLKFQIVKKGTPLVTNEEDGAPRKQ